MILPKSISPRRAAEECREIQGVTNLQRFARLDYPYTPDGYLTVTMRFYADGNANACLDGQFDGRVRAYCQRCLEVMDQEASARFRFFVVTDRASGGADDSDKDYLVVENGSLDLDVFLEDELLLTLPFTPKHAHLDCIPERFAANRPEHDHPFHALAGLKERR